MRRSKLSCLLSVAILGVAACDGAAGPAGAPGTPGTPGATGPGGATGPAGAAGATGATGENGQSGENGQAGNNGENGRACWDLDGNGQPEVATEDLNGDRVVDVRDCAGLSTGTVSVSVVDAWTGAALAAVPGTLAAAVVALDPPVFDPAEVDASGRLTFLRVPAGVYTLTATATALEVTDTSVKDAGAWVSSIPVTVSVVAGSLSSIVLRVPRLSPAINVARLHEPAIAGALYTNGSCISCHGDRQHEVAARDPRTPAWHSIAKPDGTKVHLALGCISCHATVDAFEESGAALRKQVSHTMCTSCHPNYPTLP